MTRWARSKGSAASNERVEEEATPWSQMVAGLKKVEHANPEDLDEEFGGEDEEEVVIGGGQKDVRPQSVPEKSEQTLSLPSADFEAGSDEEGSDSNDEAEDVLLEGEEVKEKKPVVLIEQEDPDEKGGKKKKKSRKRAQNNCKNCKEKGHLKKECPQLSEERRKELQDLYTMKVERKGHGTGRKKNKNKKGATEGSNSGGEEETPSAKANSESCENSSSAGKYVRLQQPGKENEPASGTPKKIDHQKTDRNVHSQKGDKNKRGKKEKKPKMDITGQEVQDDEGLFQGFRVRKESVKRLKSLAATLKADSTKSEEEIAETLKRERRKAERELAKFRKMVCFNCRQSGHLLIDCPEAKKDPSKEASTKDQGGNHCFKCGSKDHTSRDCKSKRKGADAYAFATCFICKETGHLAKSCPDNPRGLYPKGGGCRFCGSVEHLKADCDRKAQKDERMEVKLFGRTSSAGLEDVMDDEYPRPAKKNKIEKTNKKVVQF